ncbi:MAG: hypothetical protein Q8L48_43930 [Archangium sp.]|nr:hypothetical protein [Archangium sp.]
MSRWCRKDASGPCFPLLKSLLGKRGVQVELSGGMSFIDEVVSLEGDTGAEVAVFSSRRRVAVRDIELVQWVADLS